METSSKIFEGMKALQVCALNRLLISLSTFQFHMNLQTLCLIDCELSDISMLGKLKTLHILSLSRSDITELPTEAGDLENLRLLDLSYCYELRRITPNLIRRLSNLEELYLHGCSSLKWATENSTKRESYSSLSELNLLPKLVVISLDISSEHLPDGFVFRTLPTFDFCIGIERERWYQKRDLETCPISRSLRIYKSVDACKQLLEDVEFLQLNKVEGHPNLIPSLNLGFRKLTSLNLRQCHFMQCLIDASKQQVPITALSNLRKLSLSHMFHLEEMCNAPQPQGFLRKLEEVIVSDCGEMQVLFPIAELRSIEQEGPSRYLSLQSLKIVKIEGCNNLKYIFPMSVANSLGLGQLQTLRIERCSQLQEIIQGPEVLISMSQGLARLNKVVLINLPQLKGRGRNDIVLTSPSLHLLEVRDCPQLTPFIVPTNIQVLEFSEMIEKKQINNVTVPERRGGTSTCLHKLTELRVIWTGPIQVEHFQNLTQLLVYDCRRLRYIFSPTIARNLPQLGILQISDCEELEQIIKKDQTSSQHHLQPICFPKLNWIKICNCENLKCIFPITLAHGGLPNLWDLGLAGVPKLEQVFEGDETNLNKEEEKVIRLPLLYSLTLDYLPNLCMPKHRYTVGAVTETNRFSTDLSSKSRDLLSKQENSSKRKEEKLREMKRKIDEQTELHSSN
ncbi:putative disease resistance protein RGA4 [Gossypium raimondii]|uniref:putative disease resistance protein RGA4 n=1 Tax=Gossypium raimondii TaxID=29730 RepID=UPI00063AF940|nr:putative disease resistance protein RGA4 [Gossypium raimondii]